MKSTMQNNNTQAKIIGIERHRILTDGNGINTLVAFHGCPLRCKFCLNPHSWAFDHSKTTTPETLLEEVIKDDLYFRATDGGITFGGGEPLLNTEFIIQFKKICPPDWKISIETSLNAPISSIKSIVNIIDYWIIDIKDINSSIYKEYTGITNSSVLKNLKYLAENNIQEKTLIRIPIIKGYNTEEDNTNSINHVKSLGFNKIDNIKFFTTNLNNSFA